MKNKCLANSSHRKSERGNVLAYTVLSVLFLFFAVGLGVDLGHLYLAKTELQNTADAAALAGASALAPGVAPIEDRIQMAGDRAVDIMNSNRYNFDNRDYVNVMSLADQRALVEYAVNLNGPYVDEATATNNPDIRFVRVSTPPVPITIFFARPLLGGQRSLDARATAGLSVTGNVNFCIVPLTAVQCNPGDPACVLCDKVNDPSCTANTFWGVCPGSNGSYDKVPIQEGEPDPDNDGFCDPKREFCKKCTYTIRSAPSDGPSAGNYNALACAGRGGCVLRMALAAAGDCQCTASPGQDLEVDSEPGVSAGPVRQGLNVRFDDYQCNPALDPDCAGCETNPTDHPPDLNIHEGSKAGSGNDKYMTGITWAEYQARNPFQAPSNPGQVNRRVLILPITPIGEFTDSKDGREKVRPSSFGGFFMTRAVGKGNDGNIRVEYIADDIVDVIGFDPNEENTTNVVTIVLYR